MGKRSNQGATKPTSKKAKVEPALASIAEVVKEAAHLPEQCSTMLATMLPFSLAIPSDERAECQQKVVVMVEETLNTMKAEMEASIVAENSKLDILKTTMAQLVETVKEADGTLAAKTDALSAAKTALADVTATAETSSEELAKQLSAQTKCEASLASVQEDKNALEKAFQEHFQTPMEAGQGPSFKELEPFLQTMDLEKSMFATLPGTCAKAKEDRGSFDQVILEQLEKAIAARISALGEAVAAEVAALAACATAVKDAQTDETSKKEMQNQSTVAFEAAQKDHGDISAAVANANEAVNDFRPQLEDAIGFSGSTKVKLEVFENGPLANFMTYNTKAPSLEVATAGA